MPRAPHRETYTTPDGAYIIQTAETGWVIEATGERGWYGDPPPEPLVGRRALLAYDAYPELRGRPLAAQRYQGGAPVWFCVITLYHRYDRMPGGGGVLRVLNPGQAAGDGNHLTTATNDV